MKLNTIEVKTGRFGLTDGRYALGPIVDIELELKPNTKYALIPMPIPDGWHLRTDDEKYKKGKVLTSVADEKGEQNSIWSYEDNCKGGFYSVVIVRDEPEVKEISVKDAEEALREKFGDNVKIKI